MIVFLGLVLLIAAVVIGTAGVLSNSGPAHTLSDDFSLLGYHITATSGTLLPASDQGRSSARPSHRHEQADLPSFGRTEGEGDRAREDTA
ncbi:hypothetical protein ASD42_01635 [Nocardia sp. Root136]|uniref:hypothetical protein n=1 Tax=Nocardia sp. Root136 TaxID=1736458 RepID=UPI0007003A0E|nr:hypothetical protein [Nocardia sp. Root136]KQY37335.1 hypothetical protein ASD42_01635 [Nocardia sp. Root136]